MPESIALCCDCMEYMKTLPDKAFDLAVVDPPYGGGFTEGGGCMGWFAKYHQTDKKNMQPLRFHGGSKNPKDPWNKYLNAYAQERERERERETRTWNRFGERFDRYKHDAGNGTGNRSITEKGKKSLRGT